MIERHPQKRQRNRSVLYNERDFSLKGHTLSINRLKAKDRAIHDWYRFVLAYPPHLVREYLDKFEADPDRDYIYDPFSGTATTPVEARLNGFSVIGTDANHIAVLANRVKLNWIIDLEQVNIRLDRVVELASEVMQTIDLEAVIEDQKQLALFEDFSSASAIRAIVSRDSHILNGTFDPDQYIDADARKVLPKNFISPKPMKRILAVRHAIETTVDDDSIRDFMFLALANTTLATAGNVAFGPEIYSKKPKEDAPVLLSFYETVKQMVADMGEVQAELDGMPPPAYVTRDDARTLATLKEMPEIGIVITSPPYPNEKDYTRATRLENVMLGFINSRKELRELKEHLLRSNTRNVFVADDDDRYIRGITSITSLATEIENRRIELEKTSGFEKLYHRVTLLYFGGMYRHLEQLYPRLRKGGKCAYVVGDQMSFFRILIPTARLLADVATKVGYKVEGIETWRNRFSTATKQQIEENVLILSKPE